MPRLRRGDVVWWDSPNYGRCRGVIAGVWPAGYTAYRDGVRRTKPHFLGIDEAHLVLGFVRP